MNVEVETLPNCITSLRVEVPPDRVAGEWERVSREFRNQARVPGFRPGKVPSAVIEKRFEKEIREELTRKLLSETTREVIRDRKLRVLSVSDVQDLEIDADRTMRFTATLITAPEFELPEYKGIPVTLASSDVTDAEVDTALESLRERHADYAVASDREAAPGDFVVLDYEGTVDGQPLEEAVPGAGKFLASNKGFWLRLADDSFLPGFTAQIAGMRAGEEKTVPVDLPADFAAKDLAGRRIEYAVRLGEIRTQALPELDDAFAAKVLEGKTFAELREAIRSDLAREKEAEAEREKRNQVMQRLLEQIECELPEGMVRNETQRILGEIVRENQGRGIADQVLQENKQELITGASRGARDRLKGNFVLARIAEKEGIKVTPEDFQRRLTLMSVRFQMAPAKLLKELEKRDAIGTLEEEILLAKALDFVASNASVEVSPAAA
jgi:trigger factor